MSKNYYRDVIRILGEHGWAFHRPGKGSHEIWRRGKEHVTVPRHLQKRTTANGVLKKAKTGVKV